MNLTLRWSLDIVENGKVIRSVKGEESAEIFGMPFLEGAMGTLANRIKWVVTRAFPKEPANG